MARPRFCPRYIVAAKNENGQYVMATHRTFYRYSDAELFTAGVDVARCPIIITLE